MSNIFKTGLLLAVLTATAIILANGSERAWKLGALGLVGATLWLVRRRAHDLGS